ncbi:glycosyl hydrolase family 61-domain-containing protein [Penicillium subrubescens]|uniref:glycosyl hydrolase family 61-domain-containing protein n=1 Tax=Penicillium subrubescens TaxID=1316194 RepID=UPI0025456FB6|nr:glycosyl hydrolase family 61-domain-containing protein [Penicillium subrubescens]KAJ5883146.1 glycosyl hydrolase family 61-domain-containing protein [Penicillium subrubescens]
MPWKGNYNSDDFRCNTGSFQFAGQTDVNKVKAGDQIGFATDFGVLVGHPGPMQVYMSKAPGDVRDYDGSSDRFKIWELGPTSFGNESIQWGVTGKSNFTFTLPKETPAGQYLVQIEHIALHGAGEFGGAEFYFNCAQIEVESDSTETPGPVVKIPSVYTRYEPGILFYMPNVWPPSIGNSIYAEGVTGTPTGTWSAPAVTPVIGSATATSSSQVTGYSTSLAALQRVQSSSSNVLTTPPVTSEVAAETTSTLSSSSQITDGDCGTVTVLPQPLPPYLMVLSPHQRVLVFLTKSLLQPQSRFLQLAIDLATGFLEYL